MTLSFHPPKPELSFFSRAVVQVGAPQSFGITPVGERRVVPIISGRFEGKLSAEVLPGGADWQFISTDHVAHLEARYTIRTDDGSLILVHNRGLRHASVETLESLMSGEIVDPAAYYFRSTPTFETASEEYAWLNKIVSVCSGMRTADSVILDFYEVL
jgi:Protein of unknown function (DUF3237)